MTGSLVPSGRQVDLSVQWRRRLGGGAFALGAYLILEPGHRARRRPDLELLAGFREGLLRGNPAPHVIRMRFARHRGNGDISSPRAGVKGLRMVAAAFDFR